MDKKYVIVTGANGGIGKEVSKALLEANYEVIAIDLKDNNLQDLKLTSYIADLTKKEQIIDTYNIVKDITSDIYAIINCVGIFKMQSIIEGSDDDFRKIMEVNFFSIYEFNKIFIPLLHEGSRILNITSEVVRLSTQPFMGYYSLSKILLDNYSDTLRREANYLGIKVIKIRSGNMATSLTGGVNKEYEDMTNNSKHFKSHLSKLKHIMDKEMKKSHHPSVLATKIVKIVNKKNPHISYNIKNSFYLTFVGLLPQKLQDNIYKKVIK